MGLDGFSMGNLGLNTEMTSVQMATQADQLAQKGNEFIIKDVQEAAKDGGVKRKKEKEESEEQFEDGLPGHKNSKGKEDKNNFTEKNFESSDPKEFSVRLNPQTELVELYNNKEETVLETIPPKDLMELIKKMNGASGILINRKI